MSPTQKGIVLGGLNGVVIVTLATLAVAPTGVRAEEMTAIWVLAAMIAMAPGIVIGWFAGTIAGKAQRYRMPILAICACSPLGVVLLAFAAYGTDAAQLLRLWGLVCLPTLAMASVLERWTRRDVDLGVPAARVVS